MRCVRHGSKYGTRYAAHKKHGGCEAHEAQEYVRHESRRTITVINNMSTRTRAMEIRRVCRTQGTKGMRARRAQGTLGTTARMALNLAYCHK